MLKFLFRYPERYLGKFALKLPGKATWFMTLKVGPQRGRPDPVSP